MADALVQLDPDATVTAELWNALGDILDVYGRMIDHLIERLALIEELLELDDPEPAVADTRDLSTYEEAR